MKIKGLNEASQIIHEANKQKGFYDEPREIGTLLMLVVSELAEALEADRKDKHTDFEAYKIKLNSKPIKQSSLFQEYIKDTFEDEITDAIIRLFDLCGYMNIDIEKHIDLKLRYNQERPNKHGKNY